MKNVKGITLIALIITIVVLIILAGVVINLGIGEDGIFNKAKYASEQYINEQEKEKIKVNELEYDIEYYANSGETKNYEIWIEKAGIDFKKYRSIDDVLKNQELLNELLNNNTATDYLLNNEQLIKDIKNSTNYEEYAVPVMLTYAKTNKEINTKMYNSKLPCYIYNYGIYYLINSMTYVPPVNNWQTPSFTNTVENGLYFYLEGAYSGNWSRGAYYSEQTINPYNYSKLGGNTYFNTSLDINSSVIGLYNGTESKPNNWTVTVTDILTSTLLQRGETTFYQNLSELEVNSNYRLFLLQDVNEYKRSGNYVNQTYIRSLWLQ